MNLRHPLAYRVAERYGIRTAVAFQTVMICTIAVAVTAVTLNLFGVEQQGVSLALSFLCPAVIAPPVTWSFLQTHSRMVEKSRELTAALAQVQELNELLPICCSCKKIRDDDGYWDHVESYISRHSRTRFSHGICPECTEREYGAWLSTGRAEEGKS